MSLYINIKKKFNDFNLDVFFESQDEVMAVLGSSGSGKSLTLKCIAGIIEPDSGHIELDGKVLFDSEMGINLSPQQRNVGYLFQNYALFPNMTVEKNIGCGISKGNKSELIKEYIKRFRIEGLEKRYPAELSGGQQQRVALARIFASEPKLLMLDEPFSAMDSYLKWELEQELIEFLKAYKGVVLFVSHNRDEVYRLCDRVVVMSEGKSEIPFSKSELFEAPKTLAATILSGCKNISRAKKISSYTIKALDWDITLKTSKKVSDSITHVGIRAHHIKAGHRGEENTILYNLSRSIEDTFSQILLLNAGNSILRWELNKDSTLQLEEKLCIKIPKENLILIESSTTW